MEDRSASSTLVHKRHVVNGTTPKPTPKHRSPLPELMTPGWPLRISPNPPVTHFGNGTHGSNAFDLPSPKTSGAKTPTSPMVPKKSVPDRPSKKDVIASKPVHHRSTPNLLHHKIAPMPHSMASSPSLDDSLSPTKSEGKKRIWLAGAILMASIETSLF